MVAVTELRRQLKASSQGAKHDDVIEIAEVLWGAGVREPGICLAAYRSAMEKKDRFLAENWVDRGLSEKGHSYGWRFLGLKGALLKNVGSWREALVFFQDAAAEAPDQPLPLAQKGEALLHLGTIPEAAASLNQAVIMAGDTVHPSWLINLGMAELKLGNLANAKAAFSRANDILPQRKLDWMVTDIEYRISSGRENSVEATACFYDDVFSGRDQYKVHWKDSAYVESWRQIIKIMQLNAATSILDLGCGPGQFGACVNDLYPGASYHGIDFSKVAIEQAEMLLPDFSFSCAELPLADYSVLGTFDCVVCTEVLEHITQDIPVIEAIHPGTLTIFSVPNFDSFGHVRNFQAKEDVHVRYGHLFDQLEVRPFPMGGSRVLWVAHGFRQQAAIE